MLLELGLQCTVLVCSWEICTSRLWVPWRSFRILILCQILGIVAVVEVTMHIKEEEDLHIKGGLHFLVFSRNVTSQLGMNSD